MSNMDILLVNDFITRDSGSTRSASARYRLYGGFRFESRFGPKQTQLVTMHCTVKTSQTKVVQSMSCSDKKETFGYP